MNISSTKTVMGTSVTQQQAVIAVIVIMLIIGAVWYYYSQSQDPLSETYTINKPWGYGTNWIRSG